MVLVHSLGKDFIGEHQVGGVWIDGDLDSVGQSAATVTWDHLSIHFLLSGVGWQWAHVQQGVSDIPLPRNAF